MKKGLENKPVFIKNDKLVKEFLRKNKHIIYVDAFSHQMKELFFIKNHEFIGQNKEEVYKSSLFLNFLEDTKNKNAHVYYPWNHTLVKIVTKDDYLILKTNRNQDLITKDQQKKLS